MYVGDEFYDHQTFNMLPNTQGESSIRPWGHFSATGPGRLQKVEWNINAENYHQILEDNQTQLGGELRLGTLYFINCYN